MPAETPTPLPACPFCGGEAEQRNPNMPHGGMVNCKQCGAEAFGRLKWSRRVTPDAGVREALVEARAAVAIHPHVLRDETLARIDAALASTPPQVKTDAGAWRTMESAPRDGTEILVCNSKVQGGFMQVVGYEDNKADFCWATSDGPQFHLRAFTHWQPLPAPPQVSP